MTVFKLGDRVVARRVGTGVGTVIGVNTVECIGADEPLVTVSVRWADRSWSTLFDARELRFATDDDPAVEPAAWDGLASRRPLIGGHR